MDIICLLTHKKCTEALADSLLHVSPIVHVREPYIFVDISPVLHIHKTHKGALREIFKLITPWENEVLALGASPHPAISQLFTSLYKYKISYSKEKIEEFPLSWLANFEGYFPWTDKRELSNLTEVFYNLGLTKFKDLLGISPSVFPRNWGEVGAEIENRIYLRKQIPKVWTIREPLKLYSHIPEGIQYPSFLLTELKKEFLKMEYALEGRKELVHEFSLTLERTFDEAKEHFSIALHKPQKQTDFFMSLLEEKISDLDFANPFVSISLEFKSSSQVSLQKSLFHEEESYDDEKINLFCSKLKSKGIFYGFFQRKEEILPENSWSLEQELPQLKKPKKIPSDEFHTPNSHYSTHLHDSLRPTKIFENPIKIHPELERCILTEQIDTDWWKSEEQQRVYYIYFDNDTIKWIYHDKINDSFFLQGVFD